MLFTEILNSSIGGVGLMTPTRKESGFNNPSSTWIFILFCLGSVSGSFDVKQTGIIGMEL